MYSSSTRSEERKLRNRLTEYLRGEAKIKSKYGVTVDDYDQCVLLADDIIMLAGEYVQLRRRRVLPGSLKICAVGCVGSFPFEHVSSGMSASGFRF